MGWSFLHGSSHSSGSHIPNLPEAEAESARPLRIRLAQPTDKVLSICLSVCGPTVLRPSFISCAEQGEALFDSRVLKSGTRTIRV